MNDNQTLRTMSNHVFLDYTQYKKFRADMFTALSLNRAGKANMAENIRLINIWMRNYLPVNRVSEIGVSAAASIIKPSMVAAFQRILWKAPTDKHLPALDGADIHVIGTIMEALTDYMRTPLRRGTPLAFVRHILDNNSIKSIMDASLVLQMCRAAERLTDCVTQLPASVKADHRMDGLDIVVQMARGVLTSKYNGEDVNLSLYNVVLMLNDYYVNAMDVSGIQIRDEVSNQDTLTKIDTILSGWYPFDVEQLSPTAGVSGLIDLEGFIIALEARVELVTTNALSMDAVLRIGNLDMGKFHIANSSRLAFRHRTLEHQLLADATNSSANQLAMLYKGKIPAADLYGRLSAAILALMEKSTDGESFEEYVSLRALDIVIHDLYVDLRSTFMADNAATAEKQKKQNAIKTIDQGFSDLRDISSKMSAALEDAGLDQLGLKGYGNFLSCLNQTTGILSNTWKDRLVDKS